MLPSTLYLIKCWIDLTHVHPEQMQKTKQFYYAARTLILLSFCLFYLLQNIFADVEEVHSTKKNQFFEDNVQLRNRHFNVWFFKKKRDCSFDSENNSRLISNPDFTPSIIEFRISSIVHTLLGENQIHIEFFQLASQSNKFVKLSR